MKICSFSAAAGIHSGSTVDHEYCTLTFCFISFYCLPNNGAAIRHLDAATEKAKADDELRKNMLNIFSIQVGRISLNLFSMKKQHLAPFGALLKELRKNRKLTQQQLADAAGVERNYICYLERGVSDPTLGVLMGLASGLGMPLSDLARQFEHTIAK